MLIILPAHALWACDSPYKSPTSILEFEMELPSEGIGYYLDEFRIRDFDLDGDNDITALTRDETHNGLPTYSLNYYHNHNNQFCLYRVFSGETALNTTTSLSVERGSASWPKFEFAYTSANPVTLSVEDVVNSYSFDEMNRKYQQSVE